MIIGGMVPKGQNDASVGDPASDSIQTTLLPAMSANNSDPLQDTGQPLPRPLPSPQQSQSFLANLLPEGHRQLSPSFVHAFSGAVAGFASGVVTCPLDVIKTKLQAQGGFSSSSSRGTGPPRPPLIGGRMAGMANVATDPKSYKGLVGTGKVIFKEDGIWGYYRGLGPIILGYLPTWAVYFTVYEKSKRLLKEHGPETQRVWVTHIMSAMIAGGVSTMCTNPIWVIKTRLMSQANPTSQTARAPWQYANTFDAARKMYMNEGIKSFYSGLGPALLGLTHVAVQFPLYERFKKMFTGSEGLGTREGESYNLSGILAASILSKICASSATYPHEVIRTRMQTQQRLNPNAVAKKGGGPGYEPRYKGLIHATKTVYQEEGWRAFYVGMGTNMVRAVPASAMTLITYEFMVKHLAVLSNEMQT